MAPKFPNRLLKERKYWLTPALGTDGKNQVQEKKKRKRVVRKGMRCRRNTRKRKKMEKKLCTFIHMSFKRYSVSVCFLLFC